MILKIKMMAIFAAAAVVSGAGASFAHAAALPEEVMIPGQRVFPESMTSTPDGTLIIGSIGAKTIFRAKPGAAAAEAWIQPGTDGLSSIFGVLADAKSNTLWACTSTLGPPGGPATAPTAVMIATWRTWSRPVRCRSARRSSSGCHSSGGARGRTMNLEKPTAMKDSIRARKPSSPIGIN